MTALCSGGTSSAKPAFQRFIYVGPAVIGAALNNIETKLAMAIAAAVGSTTLDLATFCTTDPPAMPTITSDDVFALFNPIQIVAFLDARAKFEALVLNYLWRFLCQCDTGSQPAVPSAPSAVTSFSYEPPSIQPYPAGVPCQQTQIASAVPTGTVFTAGTKYPLPAGASYVVLDSNFVHSYTGSAGHSSDVEFTTYNAAGAVVNSAIVFNGVFAIGTFRHHHEASIPSAGSPTQWSLDINTNNATAALSVSSTVSIYCGTTPTGTGPVQTPCPPDPLLMAQLDQILQLVTLIQRQAAPFGFIDSTSHSGLTGDGVISTSGAIGARVTLTDLGFNTGSLAGDPLVLFNGGWINFGSATGFTERQFISASPIEFFPHAAGVYTQIGYSLPPGVVATITPLVREA